MPQLVKGGKYVFGWSRIADNGIIVVPPEAIREYKLNKGDKVILMSGSNTSGGFIIGIKPLLEQSALGGVLKENPALNNFQINNGETIEYKGKKYGWTIIQSQNTLKLSPQTLKAFGIKPGDKLLSGRGSYMGIAMIVKGPIVEHAITHPEIEFFQ